MKLLVLLWGECCFVLCFILFCLVILLPQPNESWDYKCALPCLVRWGVVCLVLSCFKNLNQSPYILPLKTKTAHPKNTLIPWCHETLVPASHTTHPHTIICRCCSLLYIMRCSHAIHTHSPVSFKSSLDYISHLIPQKGYVNNSYTVLFEGWHKNKVWTWWETTFCKYFSSVVVGWISRHRTHCFRGIYTCSS